MPAYKDGSAQTFFHFHSVAYQELKSLKQWSQVSRDQRYRILQPRGHCAQKHAQYDRHQRRSQ